jgi:hypothetical protein
MRRSGASVPASRPKFRSVSAATNMAPRSVAEDRRAVITGEQASAAVGVLLDEPDERRAAATRDRLGDREPSARAEDARRFGEDAVLDRREIDHAVRDDGVKARVLERESVAASFDELGLREPVAIS